MFGPLLAQTAVGFTPGNLDHYSHTEASLLFSREFRRRWCRRSSRVSMRAMGGAIAACCCAPALLAAQHPLLMLPLDDPAYAQLSALEQLGCASARVSAFRPFIVRDIRRALGQAAADAACASPLLTTLRTRFAADTVRTDSIASALVNPGVASDTGRAAFVKYRVTSDTIDGGGEAGFEAGGMLTLRATALGKGEFWPYSEDVRPVADGTPPVVGLARGRVRWSGGPQFLAVAELYGETNMRNDPTARAKSVRGSSGLLDAGQSYLNGRLGPITMSFGRSDEAWLGEDRESLVLSANGPMLDRVMLSGVWSKVRARAYYGVLDDVLLTPALDSIDPAVGPQRFHRAIVGHALSWLPTPRVELTAGETMLFSRHGAPMDFAYVNPLMPYIVTQADTGRTGTENRDNLVVFAGARAHVGRATLSGDFIIDDIQIDKRDQERTANQLGYAVTGSVPLPAPVPLIATGSYTRIWAMTYSRPFYSEVYQNYGQPLGSELGPDADMLSGELALWPRPSLQLSAGASYWRHGATRLDRRPAEGPNDHGLDGYPSTRSFRPYVQEAGMANAQARVMTPLFPVTARLDLAHITNVNNQASAAALYLRATLEGSYALKYP